MSRHHQSFQALVLSLVMAAAFALVSPAAASSRYKIGSGNTTNADPYVPRPNTTPCTVQLFSNVAFQDFNPYDFQYTPPASCLVPGKKSYSRVISP